MLLDLSICRAKYRKKSLHQMWKKSIFFCYNCESNCETTLKFHSQHHRSRRQQMVMGGALTQCAEKERTSTVEKMVDYIVAAPSSPWHTLSIFIFGFIIGIVSFDKSTVWVWYYGLLFHRPEFYATYVEHKADQSKIFCEDWFFKESHPKYGPDCTLGVHSAPNQHNDHRYEFYWG